MRKIIIYSFLSILFLLSGLVVTSGCSKDNAFSKMYKWEKKRKNLQQFSDLALLYGGSSHRKPYQWSKDRADAYVTYTDEKGKEHWLFDAFLAIEFIDYKNGMAYYMGVKYWGGDNPGDFAKSADKNSWIQLMDYWFEKNGGFDSLEQSIEDASKRIGKPKEKRKVIMTLPDAIPYQKFNDMKSPTKFWGKLNDVEMDFAKAEDRQAALKWYIDEVRARFNEKKYKYIDLAGFYIVSEDMPLHGDGWNPELKRFEECFPPISDYLHSLNECLCWIPYNRAGGWLYWKEFGIDYCYMQPGYFWKGPEKVSLERFFQDLKDKDLAMELEFDNKMLEGKPNAEEYRERIRAYMDGCKKYGIYGNKPLAYYMENETLYKLSVSKNPKDREIYNEICEFIINNPYRKKCK